MKFICDKNIISESISIVSRATNPSSAIEILKGIKIDAEKIVKLTGSDLDISIESEVAANIINTGSLIVDARLLGDIIKRMPDGALEFSLYKNNEILINAKNCCYNLLSIPAEGYPEIKEVDDGKNVKIYSKDLKNLIKDTLFAISTNESKPILTGSKFEIKENSISVISVDGYRLALKNNIIPDTSDSELSFVVKGRTLNELLKVLKDDESLVSITVKDNNAMFVSDNYKIISKLLDGEFLDYKRLIPSEYKTRVKVNVKELLNSIERAAIIINYDDPKIPIVFSIKNSVINVDCVSKMGKFNDVVDVEMNGEDLKIGFSSKFFLDALKAIDEEEVYMEFNSSQSPCVIKSIEENNFLYMVLPIKLRN